MDKDELRYACDIAQKRHSALVDLIHSNDRMTLGLMQLLLTIGSATITGAALIWFSQSPAGLPKFLCVVLLAIGTPAIAAAMLCFAALWNADINLPGTEPDLWQWADTTDDGAQKAMRIYLTRLAEGHAKNTAHNKWADRLVLWAKALAMMAPAFGLVTLLGGMACGLR